MPHLIDPWTVYALMHGKEPPKQGPAITDFPRAEPGVREYLDDFLATQRALRGDPSYEPGPQDRKTWLAGARLLYNEFNRYVPGFMAYGAEQHMRRFPETRYIKWPWTFRYLWEDFNAEEYGPKCEVCGLHEFWCNGHTEEEEFDWQGRKDIE